MCKTLYIYICTYIYMHMYINVYVYIYVSIKNIRMHLHIWYINMYIYTNIASVHVHMYHVYNNETMWNILKPVNTKAKNMNILLMEDIPQHLRLVVYPIIYRVLYIVGGCLGFLPSTVHPKALMLTKVHALLAIGRSTNKKIQTPLDIDGSSPLGLACKTSTIEHTPINYSDRTKIQWNKN